MKKDEAIKLWCPQTRIVGEDFTAAGPFNVIEGLLGRDRSHSLCIADRCAMWIWDKKTVMEKYKRKNLPESDWEGHCGLAK